MYFQAILPNLTANFFTKRRKDTSVVVYDHASKKMATINTERDVDLEHASCPTCHQPWPAHSADEEENGGVSSPDVIDPQYFRMLSHTINGGTRTSPPTSPRRRLVQAARSHRTIGEDLPSDAEFVGSSPAPAEAHHISSSAFSQNYFKKFFVEENVLGRGGKGVVLLVAHVLDGVQLGHFACKRVPVGDDHEWLRKILTEVQTLQNLSHQNLVSYRHVWLEDVQLSTFGPSVPCAFILQQYCNGGDLHNYVCGPIKPTITTEELKNRLRRRSKGGAEKPEGLDETKKLSLDEIYSFFKDITSGLRYLHASGYVHRDLKPSNCLLHRVEGEIRVLVSDFGEVQATTAVRKSTGATGTISYCAPEVLQRESPDGPYQNFTVKSDVFSLGMILYFLCFATLPYRSADVLNEENEDLDDLRAEILRWAGLETDTPKRSDLPEKLYVFLRRLLAIKSQDRPSAAEVDHAIRTGVGLSDFATSADRASSPSDDISHGERITLIDSPRRPSPVTRNSNRKAAQSTSVSQRSSSRLRQLPRPPAIHTHNEHDSASSSTRGSHQQLVRVSSPTQEARRELSSPSRRGSWEISPPEKAPLLLPPPPERTRTSTKLAIFNSPYLGKAIRGILLVAKIVSLVSPCGERAVKSFVVYPLLIAAILEFTAVIHPGVVFFTSVVHTLLLIVSFKRDALCVPENPEAY
jgi:serine/threonine protein kinase